ncbi:MAG: hypothetical protein H6Q55_507 [Deltaproteobacteria bacterium]|jgi:hypothetical protein|nr:hypothetical protein [Deltaproteobacteria bacterium]
MRMFSLLDYQHLILGLFLGLGAALVLYMSFRSAHYLKESKGREKLDQGEPSDVEGPETGRNRVPVVLLFLYGGFIVWFIFYVIYFGLRGGPL